MRITCTVNGKKEIVDDVWPGESLLFVLRERMGLPGAKMPVSKVNVDRVQ